ncbi:FAD binding domain-containing protein [Kineococcus radiotolerans]|uniref:Molybdopterin dehydrogenase FAD-binding n=1 Tax=Kineococcus radiotolerans (strain ATCC BAA-149 / DSM 14245 / SRS30216) TaxID=266940 RepID=A6W9S0_KINRD|nr:FAD binding domain-containing protein [Kineococcus radiotolerans]ABS03559.1 molybdopterin dehydrogenase FAD-binding [Kineococcus radiotolerans SRS30216 = ATCC BAA-149]
MDLNTIEAIIPVRDRAALAAAHTGAGTTSVLAGGTWLFSCEQPHLRTLVDLTTLEWQPWTVSAAGLRLAATCPVAEVAAVPARPGWSAHPLLRQCVRALLASFKVRAVATVGGNVCTALPAGAMTSLAVALDGVVELWGADGSTRHLPVAEFVVGDGRTALRPGEVLRAVDLPERALRGRTAFRRTSLQRLGRSASLVTARRDADGTFTLAVTAATPRPVVLRYPAAPSTARAVQDVRTAVAEGPGWFSDVHGDPDWRRAVTLRSVAGVVAELGELGELEELAEPAEPGGAS